MAESLLTSDRGPLLGLEPHTASQLATTLRAFGKRSQGAVIVCSQSLRLALARFVETFGGDTARARIG